jgi:hypothetical protein
MKCLRFDVGTHLAGEADNKLIRAAHDMPFEVTELETVFNMIRLEGVRLQVMGGSHYPTTSMASASTSVAAVTTGALQNSSSLVMFFNYSYAHI